MTPHPQSKARWEQVYTSQAATGVSWFQEHAQRSVQLIRRTGVAPDAALIDVGGGASTLVDDLLEAGHSKLTVLDLSGAGPLKCSGLPVMRYSADGLHAEFGAPFALLHQEGEEHHTPRGTLQKFIYCLCRREPS